MAELPGCLSHPLRDPRVWDLVAQMSTLRAPGLKLVLGRVCPSLDSGCVCWCPWQSVAVGMVGTVNGLGGAFARWVTGPDGTQTHVSSGVGQTQSSCLCVSNASLSSSSPPSLLDLLQADMTYRGRGLRDAPCCPAPLPGCVGPLGAVTWAREANPPSLLQCSKPPLLSCLPLPSSLLP